MGTEEQTDTTGRGTTERSSFTGTRGRRIFWQSWSPAGDQPINAAVTIAHGYGEHLGRYEHVARRLVSEGYVVYALDHHGHGRSEGTRGRIDLADAVADLDQLVVTAGQQRPGKRQFLLGHSLGGAIALRYALAHQDRLNGMILSGPLAALDGGAALTAIGKLLGRYAPSLPVSRIDPRWVSRDPSVVARYVADPLVYHRPVPAGSAREMLLHVETLPGETPRITLPTLLMYGTEDRLCPPRGAIMLADRLGSSDLTTHAYEGLYHEIMNEPERDRVLDEITDWLRRHLAVGGSQSYVRRS